MGHGTPFRSASFPPISCHVVWSTVQTGDGHGFRGVGRFLYVAETFPGLEEKDRGGVRGGSRSPGARSGSLPRSACLDICVNPDADADAAAAAAAVTDGVSNLRTSTVCNGTRNLGSTNPCNVGVGQNRY